MKGSATVSRVRNSSRLTKERIAEIQEKVLNGVTLTRIIVPGYNPGDDMDYVKQIIDAMWPEDVARPSTVEVNRDKWDFSGAYTPEGFFPEHDADYGEGPTITVTMYNGAELVIEEIDPSGQESAIEEFRGDWAEYTDGNDEISNAVLDTANEILALVVIKAGIDV